MMRKNGRWLALASASLFVAALLLGGCAGLSPSSPDHPVSAVAAVDPTTEPTAAAPISPLATAAPAPQIQAEALPSPTADSPPVALPGIIARINVTGADERILDFRRDPATGRLFATSTDGNLTVLDGESLAVIAELPFGGELTVDEAARRLYVSPGNRFVPDEDSLTVHIVDLDELTVVGELEGVHSLTLDGEHGRIFAGSPLGPSDDANGSQTIRVYDLESLDLLGEIDQRGIPTYNPLRDELLITTYTVLVVDPDTGEVLADLLPELSEQPFRWCNGCEYATGVYFDEQRGALVLERAKNSTGGGPGFSPEDIYLDAATLQEIESFAEKLPFQPTCSTKRIAIPPISDEIIWQRHFVRYVTYRNFDVHEMDGALRSRRDGLFAGFVNADTGQAYTSQGYVLDLDTLTPVGRMPAFCLLDVDETSGTIFARIDGDLLLVGGSGGSAVHAVPTEPEPLPVAGISKILISPDYPDDPTTFLLMADQRLYRTEDGGHTWLRIQGGLPASDGVQLTIALSPEFGSDRTMYAGGFIQDHTGEGVLRSTDAGMTWEPMWAGLNHLRVYDVRLSPDYGVDGSVQALAEYTSLSPWETGVSLHQSTDQGLHWTQVMTATDRASLQAKLAGGDEESDILPVRIAENGKTLEVLDADGAWREVDLEQREGESVLEVASSPGHEEDGTYYALGDFSLWRTADRGQTWSRWRDPRLAGRTYENSLTALAVTPALEDGSYQLLVGTNAGEFWVLSPTGTGEQPAPTEEAAATPEDDTQASPDATTTPQADADFLETDPPQGLFRPGGALASVWEASAETQSDLGWARSELAVAVPAAYQRFERGAMVWNGESGNIIVLFDDGTWRSYEDTFEEGEPESDPSLVPPGGGYQPIRGFGKLWRSEDSLRDGLGWAIDEEHGYGAYVHAFERGSLFGTPAGTVILVNDTDTEGRWR